MAVDRPPVEDEPALTENHIEDAAELSESLTWRRFMLPAAMCRINVQPVLPDRPLVVRPADAISLVPGHKTILFVSLPLWFRLDVHGDGLETAALMEVPSVVLSKSWFGLPDNGEPCYALKTRARHSLAELSGDLNRAVCFLELINSTPDLLVFERFCLRAPNLTLFTVADGPLWCGDVQARFQGVDAPVLVRHEAGAPRHAPDATVVTPARVPAPVNLRDRAFSHVKSLATRF